MFSDQAAIESFKLGIFFFLLFTSYLSFQNIVTHVYETEGLNAVGPLNLIATYLSFLISNTLAVKCKYSFKVQLFVSSIAYSLNMATGILVPYLQQSEWIYVIVTFGGLVLGTSAGFLWVSQGGYLREICKDRQNKGKYNSIFSTILSFSYIAAGFTTTFFLGYFSNQIYFIAITGLSLSSSVFCLIFLKNISQSDSQPNQAQKIDQSPLIQKPEKESISKNIIDSLKFYTHMKFMIIFLIVDGICLGIKTNQIVKLIPNSDTQDVETIRFQSGVMNIFIGFGCLVGGYVTGPVSDKFGLRFAGILVILFYAITCSLTFFESLYPSYWLGYCVSFLWGYVFNLFETWISVSILKIYEGKLQAFAINKQVNCISMALFQLFVILTSNNFQIKWLMIAIVSLSIIMVLSLLKINYKKQKYGSQSSINKQNN